MFNKNISTHYQVYWLNTLYKVIFDHSIRNKLSLYSEIITKLDLNLKLSGSYRPSARGYVIYSPRALPSCVARGQRTRGINHITTS